MIITVAGQRAIEAKAVEKGISLSQLMDTAGQKAFLYVKNNYNIKDMAIPVLCGSGGNGGDGFVVARHLKQAGAVPMVVLCSGTPKASAPSLMYKRAVSDGVPVVDLALEWERIKEAIEKCDLIIDAVYGIGFHGELNEQMQKITRAVNASSAKVIAIDMPSGVNADSGAAAADAIRADETVGFIGKKVAQVLKSAAKYCGRVTVEDIGIPEDCYQAAGNALAELDESVVLQVLSPKPEDGHKGNYGRLLLTVGSERYRGAASLAAMGALCTGAGLVTVASTEKALNAVAANIPEAILFDLQKNATEYAEQLARADACLIGCGLTVTDTTESLFRSTIANANCPLVIDADGINILANDLKLLGLRKGELILTPHVGEFARLTGLTAEEILSDRIKHARAFAEKYRVVLVLKSENTVVALPGGQVLLNTIGNSGLAKAGSGDLLAGVIAALLAMGKKPAEAAAAGVYLHSLAADIAAETRDRYSLTASFIAPFVSDAYRRLFQKQ